MSVYRRKNDSRRFGSSSGAVVAIPLVLFAVCISAQKCILIEDEVVRGASPFSSIVANKDDLESQDDVLVTSFSGNETKLISKQRKIPLISRLNLDLPSVFFGIELGIEFQPYFSLCESEFRNIAS